jgi:general stress protein YciG
MSDNTYDDRNQNSGRKQPGANGGEQSVSAEQSTDQAETASTPKTGSRRGFAAMDEQTQRAIASKGGHSQGKENNRGNFWHDRERARIAGRKGGEAHGKNRQEPVNALERQ